MKRGAAAWTPGRDVRIPQLDGLRGLAILLYLFHQPVLMLSHGWFQDQFPALRNGTDLAITLVALIVTLLLATASWFLFEKPLVILARRARY